MITRPQAERLWLAGSMARLVSAMHRAADVDGCDIDISRRVLDVTQGINHPEHIAVLLAPTVRELSRAGRHEEALILFREALAAARTADQGAVLNVIAEGCDVLATEDNGATVREVLNAVLSLDNWWTESSKGESNGE